MGHYLVSRSSYTPTVGNDILTVIAAAGRPVVLRKIGLVGLGTVFEVQGVRATRSTGGTTGGGALTPSKRHTDQAAFAGTVYTTWAAQPTLVSDDGGVRMGFRADGGVNWWIGELILRPTEQLSIRQEVGIKLATILVEMEEQ